MNDNNKDNASEPATEGGDWTGEERRILPRVVQFAPTLSNLAAQASAIRFENLGTMPAAPAPAAPSAPALLPEDAAARKTYPVLTGMLMYFPRTALEVAHVSYLGNAQHNPGQPLHWARGKSMDQLDAALRHVMEYKAGHRRDAKGYYVLAQAVWRLMAECELALEADAAAIPATKSTP